jgi:hypothetical protein
MRVIDAFCMVLRVEIKRAARKISSSRRNREQHQVLHFLNTAAHLLDAASPWEQRRLGKSPLPTFFKGGL